MGWDDNGLPTERRVQNYYGVRCDPSLPYDPGFAAAASSRARPSVPVSRRNFVELCERLTAEDEQAFEEMWRRLGLSVDWSLLYTTISDRRRRISQRAFLRNLARGEAYRAEAPTLWDVTFQTAVAQAELEDREHAGACHRISFHAARRAARCWIETTRPELLPACVALVAHPDDERYQPLFGSTVTTPVFGVEVPVLAHPLAEPDKGSGIAMVLHLRRPDRRDLVAGARPARCGRSSGATGGCCPTRRPGVPAGPYEELAGQDRVLGPRADGRAAARERRPGRRAAAGHPAGEVLRAGRKAAGDRHLGAVVHQNGGREARTSKLLRPGERAELAPGAHAGALRELGVRAGGRLADLAAAVLRGAVPGLVPGGRRGAPVYSSPIVPDEVTLPVDPAA